MYFSTQGNLVLALALAALGAFYVARPRLFVTGVFRYPFSFDLSAPLNGRILDAYQRRVTLEQQAVSPAYGVLAGAAWIAIGLLLFLTDARLLCVLLFCATTTLLQALATYAATKTPGPRAAALAPRRTTSVLPWYVIAVALIATTSAATWAPVAAHAAVVAGIAAFSTALLLVVFWRATIPSALQAADPQAAAFVDTRFRTLRAAGGLMFVALPLIVIGNAAPATSDTPGILHAIASWSALATLGASLYLQFKVHARPNAAELRGFEPTA